VLACHPDLYLRPVAVSLVFLGMRCFILFACLCRAALVVMLKIQGLPMPARNDQSCLPLSCNFRVVGYKKAHEKVALAELVSGHHHA